MWTGVLKDLAAHTLNCEFADVVCPRGCGEVYAKKDEMKHLNEECGKKSGLCEFCKKEVQIKGMQIHLKVCPSAIIDCPNKCGLEKRSRNEINDHLPLCPKAGSACPFAEFGCAYSGGRENLQKHIKEQPVKHLSFLCDGVLELKQLLSHVQLNMEKMVQNMDTVQRRIDNLEKLYGAQFIWRIDNVKQKQNEAKSGARSTIFSAPFLSGRHGYKLILSASLYGDGPVRGQYLSIFISIMRGEYDPLLSWPFVHKVTFTLMDQNPNFDARNHISYVIKPHSSLENKPFLDRPISERNASFGAQKFCELEIAEHYVRDDVMFIKCNIDTENMITELFESMWKTNVIAVGRQTPELLGYPVVLKGRNARIQITQNINCEISVWITMVRHAVFLNFLIGTLLVGQALGQSCWRDTPCSNITQAAFSGAWDANIYAPSSRINVPPKTILALSTLQVISSYPGTANLVGDGSGLVFDYGVEVAGLVSIQYTVSGSGSGAVGLAFSEVRNLIGESSDLSAGRWGNDGALYSNFTAPGNYNYSMPDHQLRGGFRYVTIFLQSNSSVSANITGVSLEVGFQPTWSNLRAYQGYFYSNDAMLNAIWYSGAHTLSLCSVPVHYGRAWPEPNHGWANNDTLGNGSTIIVDGAKRDRWVWPGDYGIAVPSYFYSIGDMESTKNALQALYMVVSVNVTGFFWGVRSR